MKKTIFVFVLFFSISCSTPYQQSDFMGGFKETKLENGNYLINFGGNGYTSK